MYILAFISFEKEINTLLVRKFVLCVGNFLPLNMYFSSFSKPIRGLFIFVHQKS